MDGLSYIERVYQLCVDSSKEALANISVEDVTYR